MQNLATKPPQDKQESVAEPSHDDAGARDYLRSELAHVAAGMTIQLEILERYCQLGDDRMALHTVRQIRPAWKMMLEIGRRMHELREEARS